ncbi:hypothetical protein ACFVXQ_11495 [Kitasatospora sp. NPDC058263]
MSDIEMTVDEGSDSVPATPEDTAAPADPTDPTAAIRSEIHQEYATRLVHAELRIRTAVGGFQFPDGFLDLLDSSKLLGEDGEPCTDAIYEGHPQDCDGLARQLAPLNQTGPRREGEGPLSLFKAIY